jgi:hypothetical protein
MHPDEPTHVQPSREQEADRRRERRAGGQPAGQARGPAAGAGQIAGQIAGGARACGEHLLEEARMSLQQKIRNLMSELRDLYKKEADAQRAIIQRQKALSRLQAQEAMSSPAQPATTMSCR